MWQGCAEAVLKAQQAEKWSAVYEPSANHFQNIPAHHRNLWFSHLTPHAARYEPLTDDLTEVDRAP